MLDRWCCACQHRPVTKKQPRAALDDVSKAIIEQLQQDGRRSYAAIGKVVGLSEAAVRQRVQRLIDGGVMQVVAVTDPLELGFARQAMVGVRVNGPMEPVADALADLDEVDYVVITAGVLRPAGRGRLRERRAPPRGDLGQDPPDHRRGRHRDVHVPQAAQADLLVGCALSPDRSPQRAPDSSLVWHETVAGRPGPLDRPSRETATPTSRSSAPASPGSGPRSTWRGPTRRCGSPSLEARDRGLRRQRPQRRLVLGAVPVLARSRSPSGRAASGALALHAGDAAQRRRGAARRRQAEGIDAHVAKGGTIVAGPVAGRSGRGPRPRSSDARAWGRDEDDVRLLDADEATGVLAAHPRARRDVHPGLRGHPSRRAWSAAWPTPSYAAASRSTSSTPAHGDRARVASSPATGPCAPST